MNFMLSTCGTSVLTNKLQDNSVRTLLNRYANAVRPEEVPAEERRVLQNRISESRTRFLATSVAEASAESAELAGILAFYNNDLSNVKGDQHFLLATDTWLGSETSALTRTWLENNGINASVYRHNDLQTADWHLFSSSLSDLVKWCHETISPLRDHYSIVFNLSGGFKSETGFLQVLGMFYADETVYIFERSKQLMRIPRLPICMNDAGWVTNDLADIRRSSLGLAVTTSKSGIFWCTIDGSSTLTPWGELVFDSQKSTLYQQRIHPSPSPRVHYSPSFIPSCSRETTAHRAVINATIDGLARFMEDPNHPNLRSLDFKPLRGNPVPGSTHECDAWHDGGAKRIFCHYENEILVLDVLGNHL